MSSDLPKGFIRPHTHARWQELNYFRLQQPNWMFPAQEYYSSGHLDSAWEGVWQDIAQQNAALQSRMIDAKRPNDIVEWKVGDRTIHMRFIDIFGFAMRTDDLPIVQELVARRGIREHSEHYPAYPAGFQIIDWDNPLRGYTHTRSLELAFEGWKMFSLGVATRELGGSRAQRIAVFKALAEANETLHRSMVEHPDPNRIERWKVGNAEVRMRFIEDCGFCIHKDDIGVMVDNIILPPLRPFSLNISPSGPYGRRRDREAAFHIQIQPQWSLASLSQRAIGGEDISQSLWHNMWRTVFEENAHSVEAITPVSIGKPLTWTLDGKPMSVMPTEHGLAVSPNALLVLRAHALSLKLEKHVSKPANDYYTMGEVLKTLGVMQNDPAFKAVWAPIAALTFGLDREAALPPSIVIRGQEIRLGKPSGLSRIGVHGDDLTLLRALIGEERKLAETTMMPLREVAQALSLDPPRIKRSALWRAYDTEKSDHLPERYRGMPFHLRRAGSEEEPVLYVHTSATPLLARYFHAIDPKRPEDFLTREAAAKALGVTEQSENFTRGWSMLERNLDGLADGEASTLAGREIGTAYTMRGSRKQLLLDAQDLELFREAMGKQERASGSWASSLSISSSKGPKGRK